MTKLAPFAYQSFAALEYVGHTIRQLPEPRRRAHRSRARSIHLSLKEPRLYALHDLGWTDSHTTEFEPHAAGGLLPARVAAQHRGAYVLFSELGELRADTAGRLSHEANGAGDLPAVGDWVADRRAARRGRGDDPARLRAADEVLAQGRAPRRRGAGARGERRRRLPRHVAERGLQPAPARALHHDGVGERRAARDRADEDRPLPRLGAARARGRGDRVRRARARDLEHLRRRASSSSGRTSLRAGRSRCSARRASASRRS